MLNTYEKLEGIPGSKGLPFVGHLFDWMTDASGFYNTMQKKYGDVFRYKAVNQSHVVVLGPEANKLILVDESKFVESQEAWEQALGELFPNGLMLMDGERHKKHRGIMNEAFKKEPMQGYLEIMPNIISDQLDILNGKSTAKMFPYFKNLTLQLAGTVFFGFDPKDDLTALNQAVSDIVTASASLPIDLPFTNFRKGKNGRKTLIKFFTSIIDERRKNPGKDLFSKMCLAKSEDGSVFTDKEIIDHLIFVLMASHDTTAITLTMMTYLLAKHPEWQDRIRNEAENWDINGDLTVTGFRQMNDLILVMKETLRLYAPLISVSRKNLRPIEVGGHTIPTNTSINLIMRFNHYDERVWTNPEQFDPERFNRERKEHQGCPFAYAPFGAGPHYCIGYQFAEMQIKMVMSEFIKRYKVSLKPGYEIPVADIPLTHPKDDLPIILEAL